MDCKRPDTRYAENSDKSQPSPQTGTIIYGKLPNVIFHLHEENTMSFILITGASSGIGEAFAQRLAAQGHALILVARREAQLRALANQLHTEYQVTVEVIIADLTESNACQMIEQTLIAQQWTLNGLINNAGFGDKGAFTALPLSRQLGMIQLNVTALVELTYRVLPHFQTTSTPFIINVASIAGFLAGPNMAVYYATKAFVLSFSEALTEELKPQGIDVSALCPGATQSEFAAVANLTDSKLFASVSMTSQEVAKQSLAQKHKAIVVTGLRNRITLWLMKFSSRALNRKMAARLQT